MDYADGLSQAEAPDADTPARGIELRQVATRSMVVGDDYQT
ncbi:hypothetical protein [Arthrobacter sp.]